MSSLLSRALLGGGRLAAMACQSSPPASEAPATPSLASPPAEPMQPLPGAGRQGLLASIGDILGGYSVNEWGAAA